MYGRVSFITLMILCGLSVLLAGSVTAQDEAVLQAAAEVTIEPAHTEFMGKPISLDVQEAEIGTVLRSLAGFSGANIVASPRVEGKVTIKLEEVPWIEAMTVILRAHSFDFVEESGIYRIDTAEQLRQEKLSVERARKQVEDLAELRLGNVKLSFANAEEVKDALSKMLTERGNIDVDVRTNTLLINDVEERVAMIRDMALELDTMTPQVEINARLVDMDLKATRELGINWNLTNITSPGNNLVGGLEIDNSLQSASGSMRVATVQNWGELMLQIQALENDNRAQLISNPVITTTDNRKAKILVGQKIPLIVADEAGNAITQLTTIGIGLEMTPHINSDNKITLDIHNEVSDLSSQATVQGGVIINTSEADTRVLVENGETAIIAGLIREVESTLNSGIPVLQSIPLLGALFRHQTKASISRELVIFVTPRIVTDEYLHRQYMTPGSVVDKVGQIEDRVISSTGRNEF